VFHRVYILVDITLCQKKCTNFETV